ncbi:MAG: multiheme c-type cytochrome [Gammaproteobacteria bacterium]|nr:multiheme c-type cytochrome [Gammaproteobacteria bacterium]
MKTILHTLILLIGKKPYRVPLLLWLMFTGTVSAAESAQPAEFVGSANCNQCHQEQYAAWRQSDHRMAMQPADKTSVLGDFNNVTVNFHGIETRLFRRDGGFRVATLSRDGKPDEFSVAYTFGHYPLQQYLVDIGAGRLQALNVAWDSRAVDQGGQRWFHLQADEDIDAQHPFFWTGHLQNANSRCIECHSIDLRKNYSPESASYTSQWAEAGVGCESCHGPASRHLSFAGTNELSKTNSGFSRQSTPPLAWTFHADSSIASADGKRDDSYIDTCGGCHSRRASIGDVKPLAAYHDQYRLALLDPGLYFANGQIDDEVFVLGSFLQSKMSRQGVTCNNCHDVHSGKLIAEGNAVCAQCHKPAVFDQQAHHRHPAGSTGALCVNCHMPERVYMQVDPRRDHSFSIPNPGFSQAVDAPNACTNCHQGKTSDWATATLENWRTSRNPDSWAELNHDLSRQDAFAFKRYAQSRPGSNLPPIREATLLGKLVNFPSRLAVETASRQLASPDPLLRRGAISALQAMPLQLRWQLLSPLIDDPVKSVRLEVANALADALNQLPQNETGLARLIEEYRNSLNHHADSPAGQLALGNLESLLGYDILAEQAFKKALEIEPSFVPALINLADLYRATGSDGEASKLLKRALELAPDSATSNHAYGLFLVRRGKHDAALPYLQAAINQQDSSARHVYVYAVALDSRGQTDAAMRLIEEQRNRWPNNIDLSFLQVSYMEKTGKTDGIHRYLSLLASVAASNPQVQAWVSKFGGA